jgi:hypothetical protein
MTLEGSLHDLSLSDLLQLFRIGVKTGVLWLIGSGEQGALYVRAGCLIDAELVRGSARQVIATADDAVIQLLQWQDARFTFQPDTRLNRHPARMIHDHEWLVQEASRLRERALQAAPDQALTPNTCFVLSKSLSGTCFVLSKSLSGTTGVFKLDIVQWRILGLVALAPNASALSARTGVQPDQVLAVLAQLLALGLVEIEGLKPLNDDG